MGWGDTKKKDHPQDRENTGWPSQGQGLVFIYCCPHPVVLEKDLLAQDLQQGTWHLLLSGGEYERKGCSVTCFPLHPGGAKSSQGGELGVAVRDTWQRGWLEAGVESRAAGDQPSYPPTQS